METYLLVAVGVAISVVLPIVRQSLPVPSSGTAGVGGLLGWVWQKAKPYLAIGAFSLVTAVLIVAFTGDTFKSPQAALLAGYAWDSTIQKLKG